MLFIGLFSSRLGASLNYSHFGLTSRSLATSSYEWHSFSLLSAFVQSQRLSILHSDSANVCSLRSAFPVYGSMWLLKQVKDKILATQSWKDFLLSTSFSPSSLPWHVWFKPHSILFLQSHQWCKISPLLIPAQKYIMSLHTCTNCII